MRKNIILAIILSSVVCFMFMGCPQQPTDKTGTDSKTEKTTESDENIKELGLTEDQQIDLKKSYKKAAAAEITKENAEQKAAILEVILNKELAEE